MIIIKEAQTLLREAEEKGESPESFKRAYDKRLRAWSKTDNRLDLEKRVFDKFMLFYKWLYLKQDQVVTDKSLAVQWVCTGDLWDKMIIRERYSNKNIAIFISGAFDFAINLFVSKSPLPFKIIPQAEKLFKIPALQSVYTRGDWRHYYFYEIN